MPTDDERREVARRLRETGEELGSAALLWYHIAKALGVRAATDGKTACGMLADLIEPNQDNIRTASGNIGTVSGIERDALLALAQEINDTSCDNHGELSVSLGDIWGWAQAIREALGGGAMKDCRYYDECNGEPECPHRRTCPFYSPMPDRDALLALADEFDAQGDHIASAIDAMEGNFDQDDIDAMVEQRRYARRIREALGVVE